MREEIRLGNEALARHDLDAAAQYFQKLLDTGGSELQERIAVNRLRDIATQRAAAEARSQPAAPKSRPRRKTATRAKETSEPVHRFVRQPDDPVVVIKRH